MTSRNYPPNSTPAQRREIDNLSDHAAYAYGFSDEKPGWRYFARLALVIGFLTFIAWGIHHA